MCASALVIYSNFRCCVSSMFHSVVLSVTLYICKNFSQCILRQQKLFPLEIYAMQHFDERFVLVHLFWLHNIALNDNDDNKKKYQTFSEFSQFGCEKIKAYFRWNAHNNENWLAGWAPIAGLCLAKHLQIAIKTKFKLTSSRLH